MSTHVVIESRWPRSSPSLTPVKSTARARAPISTTSRFAGPQGVLGTVSRRSPTWSSGIGRRSARRVRCHGLLPSRIRRLLHCAQTPCVQHTHGPRRLSLVSVQENRGRRIDARAPVEDGGPGVRDDLRQACGVSHRSVLDREAHHTSPTPSRPGNCFENLRGRRPLSNYAGTALAGRHRHLNRARRGIRSANLDRQKYRPEGGATWL